MRQPTKPKNSLALALARLMTSVSGWSGQFDDATEAKARGDFSLAFASFNQLANSGNSNVQFELSLLSAKGKGVQPNPWQALYWLKQAAAHGNAQ